MRFSVVAALVLAATVAVWAPSITHGWNYEDRRYASDLIEGRVAWGIPKRLATNASWALDRAVMGIQPSAFHMGNVAWHAANVGLLLVLAWSVMPGWGAIAAALIFALHPAQTETVAYVSSRGDLVAGAGLLLALCAASAGSVTGAVLGVALAVLAKETALVAWGLVLLWAAWTHAPFSRRQWRALLVLSIVGLSLAVWMTWRYAAETNVTISPQMAGEQLADLGRLLLLIPWPVGQTIDHEWTAIAWLWPIALSAGLLATGAALYHGWRESAPLAFAWLWTLIVVSPRLVVPLYEGLHEHHLYWVFPGWCLCAGHWLTTSRAEG